MSYLRPPVPYFEVHLCRSAPDSHLHSISVYLKHQQLHHDLITEFTPGFTQQNQHKTHLLKVVLLGPLVHRKSLRTELRADLRNTRPRKSFSNISNSACFRSSEMHHLCNSPTLELSAGPGFYADIHRDKVITTTPENLAPISPHCPQPIRYRSHPYPAPQKPNSRKNSCP